MDAELLIIGAGPAGLSAAIYAARAGLKTMVLGCKPKFAGDYDIDNYFGFPETISGRELQERGLAQAQRFGVATDCERVLGVHPLEDGTFEVKTEQRKLTACAVILATGVSRVRPGISNLADYEGKGVSYCVSCDGFFYRGKPVLVVGEAIFAANQALELTEYTKDVSICTQGKEPQFGAEFAAQITAAGIPVLTQKIASLEGAPGLERVVFADGAKREAYGLFVAMGEASSSDFALTLGLARDGQFITVDHEQRTNLPGIFAAGDCTGGFMQIAVAVGEGAKAGHAAISYVKKQCRGGKS